MLRYALQTHLLRMFAEFIWIWIRSSGGLSSVKDMNSGLGKRLLAHLGGIRYLEIVACLCVYSSEIRSFTATVGNLTSSL